MHIISDAATYVFSFSAQWYFCFENWAMARDVHALLKGVEEVRIQKKQRCYNIIHASGYIITVSFILTSLALNIGFYWNGVDNRTRAWCSSTELFTFMSFSTPFIYCGFLIACLVYISLILKANKASGMEANMKVLVIYTVSMLIKLGSSITVMISLNRVYEHFCSASSSGGESPLEHDPKIYIVYSSLYIVNSFAIAYLLYSYGISMQNTDQGRIQSRRLSMSFKNRQPLAIPTTLTKI